MAEYLGLTRQIFFAGLIEVAMILVTLALLDVPNIVLPVRSAGARSTLRVTGMIMLCLTFCWSVVLGCVLALNSGTYRL
ncbi:MAG: hypothetical protein P4M08_07460 [Oligoflexia bacterium]|nr:hypothetical protein [Oligoflexia bacterium]